VVEQGARLVDGRLVVAVQLDGQAAEFLVDTGSGGSLITPEAAQRLGLRRSPVQRTLILGAGGSAVSADAEVQRFSIGSVTLDRRTIAVGAAAVTPDAHVDGLLGMDVLSKFEIDLDIPQSRLGLWLAEGCGAAFDPLQGGGPHFALPAVRAASGQALVPVRLDGTTMLGLLDSGAAGTIVKTAAASYVGVTPAVLAQEPGGIALGTDLHQVALHTHRFPELVIGPEHYRNITLAVGPVQVSVLAMLVGADYLEHHRVWISHVVPRVFIARSLSRENPGSGRRGGGL